MFSTPLFKMSTLLSITMYTHLERNSTTYRQEKLCVQVIDHSLCTSEAQMPSLNSTAWGFLTYRYPPHWVHELKLWLISTGNRRLPGPSQDILCHKDSLSPYFPVEKRKLEKCQEAHDCRHGSMSCWGMWVGTEGNFKRRGGKPNNSVLYASQMGTS